METPVPKVYGAIRAVMAAMAKEGIAKDRENGQQKFMFRGIDDVYASLCHKLVEANLLMLPRVASRDHSDRQTKNGGTLIYSMLTIEYDLISVEDGSKHTISTVGEAMDSGDKSSNKAMSAAYKYGAIQAFCIPTEGDNDADATTHELAGNPPPAQQQQPRQRQAPAGQTAAQRPAASQQQRQPTENEITSLSITLMNAAKKGETEFKKCWAKNPGPTRLSIFNDKAQMAKFEDAMQSAAQPSNQQGRSAQHAQGGV